MNLSKTESVCGALVEAVRHAATHNGFHLAVKGHRRPEVDAALDAIEQACRRGTPEIEIARKLIADLNIAVSTEIPGVPR